LTAILAGVIGPTYDNILVPELTPAALFPSLAPSAPASASFLGVAAAFSTYLLGTLVDPLIGVVALAVGFAYLGRSFLGRNGTSVEPLLTRLILAVLLANFSLPLAGALVDLAGGAYPVIAGFDGGAWQHWVNLGGFGEIHFSWDNGVVAFVLSFVLFSLVLLLAAAVALRDALLGVLLVLLPLFTLLWPIPPLAGLARRAWFLFGEAAFLPCVLVIPLELAVGTPSIFLLVGYLTVALAAPTLLSAAGTTLSGAGFPSAGGALVGGVQRGLLSASQATSSFLRPLGQVASLPSSMGKAIGTAGRTIGGAALPAAIPVLAGDLLGRGAHHLLGHLLPAAARSAKPGPKDRQGPVLSSGGRSRA
jgi:hypothetical protein